MRFIFVVLCLFSLAVPSQGFADDFDLIAQRNKQRANFFTPYDTNFDGSLNMLEIHQKILHDFHLLDLNKNQVIDPDERVEAVARYGQTYAYIYGAALEGEARDYEARLRAVDLNDDEVIEFVEYFSYFVDRFTRMDSDKDGLIALQEYRSASEKVSPR